MSKNIGVVVFHSDSKKMWIKYNATIEQCYPKLYDDPDDVVDNWYTNDWPICSCDSAETATVYPYDIVPPKRDTIRWDIMACRKCKCIKTNLQQPTN